MTTPAIIAQVQTITFITKHNHNTMTNISDTPERQRMVRVNTFINREISKMPAGDRKVLTRLDVTRWMDGQDIATMCDEARGIIEGAQSVQ